MWKSCIVILADLYRHCLGEYRKVPQEYMNSNRFDEYLVQVEHDFAGLCKQSSARDFIQLPPSGKWWCLPRWGFDCGRIDAHYTGEKMSFTVAVKEEILGQHHLSRHELSAIIKMSGSIGLSRLRV